MIPLRCSNPDCRSRRVTGYRRPFCRECGTYISPRSLSRQISKRRQLGTDRRKAAGTHNRNSVCMEIISLHKELKLSKI